MTATTTTTSSSTVSNKERLILFHTPDPTELGINLTHGPDGHVRITYNCNEVDIANSSIIDGHLTNGDVVCEAAGVNMRHPISDHMWKLTLGLMKVAPRPIEIYVVSDDDGIVSSDDDERDNDDGTEVMNDTTNVNDSVNNTTSYYQLEATGENKNIITAQAFNILDGSPLRRKKKEVLDVSLLSSVGGDDDNSVRSNDDEHHTQQIEAVRNPFQDKDRFGPERRIIFHTPSLGVKLHRSPTEGIVHILHVTPYIPFNNAGKGQSSSSYDSKPVREGPDNGRIETGDTILEVGGVDLRNKVIGRLEWADMVHFIKHVGRPLDMIIAKDKLFTRERAGVANVFDRDVRYVQAAVEEVQLRQQQEEERGEDNNVVVGRGEEDVNEEGEEVAAGDDNDEDKENQEEHQHQLNPLVDNVCFNVAVDDICNLPCTGGSEVTVNEGTGIIVSTSSKRQDNSWIKKFDDDEDDQQEEKKAGLAKDEKVKNEDDNNDVAVADVSLVRDNMWSPKSKDAHPWNKKMQQVEGDSEVEKKLLNVETANVSEPVETDDAPLEPEIDMSVDKSMVPMKPSPVKEDIVVVPTKQPEEAKPSSTSSAMSFYSRTHPTGKSAVVTSPCVVPALLEDANRSLSSDEDDVMTSTVPSKQSKTPPRENKKKKVAELKKMFSPVRMPATSPSSPKDEAISVSSEEKKVKVKGLFSPISSPPISPSNGSVASPSSETKVDRTNNAREADIKDRDPAKMSPSNKRNELAQLILKEKRTSPVNNEEQQPASPSDDGIGIQVPQLEQTPEKPFDETINTTFESTFMNNLRDEFQPSPENKTLHLSESRDDDDAVHHWKKDQHGDAKILAKPDKKDYSLSGRPQQQQKQQEQRGLSPTGSTVSVEDNVTSMKKKSNNVKPQFFSDRSFHAMDCADSPFVGNIKFATPTQRPPASALFSQAFVVQHQGSVNNAGDSEDGQPNVRWIQTDSPLFVTKKNMEKINSNVKVIDNNADGSSSHLQFYSTPTRTQPPPQSTHFFDNACGTGFGLNLSAFDMTNLSLNNNNEEGKSLADEPEYESPSFELNETIVYADGPEDAPMDCCGVSNALCGSDNMFEGLVSPCGNADTYRQDKERMNKVPSPRRKNLLSRLRNKKKKTKATNTSSKVEYGNLDDDYDEKEAMKGVKKAHVQLTKQNILGKSMAAASQFALLIDDEMDM